MIKRSTWVYFLIFLALAVTAIVLQRTSKKDTDDGLLEPVESESGETTATPTPPLEFLFPSDAGTVTSIFIESRAGNTLGIERQNDVWVATKPFQAEVVQSSVDEAAGQLLYMQALDVLDLPNSDVGLDAPGYTLTIGFSDGTFIIAQVGDETPSGNGYYVRKEGGPVLVIGKYSLQSLINLLELPPYVASPTPTITSTPAETSTPTPAPAAETHAPTATNAP